MTDNSFCEIHLDELLSKQPVSPEMAGHLAQCSHCREIRQKVSALRAAKSAFPKGPSESSKQDLLKRVRSNQPPAKVPFKPANILIGAFTVAVLAGAISFVSFREPLTIPIDTNVQGGYSIAVEGEPEKRVPFSKPFEIAKGTAKILLPSGASLEITGPTRVQIGENGLKMPGIGKILVSVKPSPVPFVGKTSSANVKTSGAVFSCTTTNESTRISVISGEVQVVGTPEVILKAGSYFELPKRAVVTQPPATSALSPTVFDPDSEVPISSPKSKKNSR